jgi:hypothetical protein
MHKSESLISSVYYGFNEDHLFIRIDPAAAFDALEDGVDIAIITSKPADIRITCPVKGNDIRAMLFEKVNEKWALIKEIADVAVRDIFEISIPFEDLKAKQKDELNLFISIRKKNDEIERCPWRGHISLSVPTPDFEAIMWY